MAISKINYNSLNCSTIQIRFLVIEKRELITAFDLKSNPVQDLFLEFDLQEREL